MDCKKNFNSASSSSSFYEQFCKLICFIFFLGKFETTGDGLLVALEVLFEIRKGRKPGTLVSTLKNPILGIPTILIGLDGGVI